MNVGFLTTSFPKFIGDSHAPWILEMAEKLVVKSIHINVMAPSHSTLRSYEKINGVDVYRFRYAPKRWECVAYGANIPANLKKSWLAKLMFPFFIIFFIIAAIRLNKQNDIIHAQFGYSGLFSILANYFLKNKKKIIVSFYGRDVAHAKKLSFLYGFLFRNADKILVLSNDMKNKLIEYGAPEQKVIIHHLGVDFKKFVNNKNNKNNKNIICLSVANFVEKKGLDQLIYAFALVSRQKKSIQLNLVGRGPLEEKLKTLVRKLKIVKFVKFINNYEYDNPRLEVIKQMNEADIFILPGAITKTDYGGTPIVLMEAGAMKLPSITTQNAGNKEIVINNKTGYVVEDKNYREITEKINILMNNKKLRVDMGMQARKQIYDQFEIDKQISLLLEIYKNVIQK